MELAIVCLELESTIRITPIPEDLLVVNANEYIGDSVYEIYIGSYDTSNEHMEMYINCFEYNGRYYVLGFSTAVSGVGG